MRFCPQNRSKKNVGWANKSSYHNFSRSGMGKANWLKLLADMKKIIWGQITV